MMEKFTVTSVNEWQSVLFVHALAKNAAQLKPILKIVYPDLTPFLLAGHCQAADGRIARDLAADARAHVQQPEVSCSDRNTLEPYLAWLAGPTELKAARVEVKRRQDKDQLVKEFVRNTVGTRVRMYTGGDFSRLYQVEFGYPDYLFFNTTGSCPVKGATHAFHENTGGRLRGVEAGYYQSTGCRQDYEVPGVGKVIVDFWALRHYQDES